MWTGCGRCEEVCPEYISYINFLFLRGPYGNTHRVYSTTRVDK